VDREEEEEEEEEDEDEERGRYLIHPTTKPHRAVTGPSGHEGGGGVWLEAGRDARVVVYDARSGEE
jgi:hypothetical protein